MDALELTQQALAIGLIAKAAVDVYRKLPIASPGWALLLSALVISELGSIGLTYAKAGEMTGPSAVGAMIVGFLGFAGAVAATELHNKVREGEAP